MRLGGGGVRICPFCSQPMGFPTEFPELRLQQRTLAVLHKLWSAKGEVVIYDRLHPSRRAALTHLGLIRCALRDSGLPWVVIVDRDIGARLVKVEKGV